MKTKIYLSITILILFGWTSVWAADFESQTINGDDIVIDHDTNLTWEVKTDTNKNDYSWTNTSTHINALNAGTGYAGFTDWRVPTREELRSIVDYNKTNPSIDTTYFPNTISAQYWTNDPEAGASPSRAWAMSFNDGDSSLQDKVNTYHIRAVRGTLITPSYTKIDGNGDPLPPGASSWVIVKEENSGLYWEVKTPNEENEDSNWDDAQAHIDALNTTKLGGFDDWRFPTVKELALLVDLTIEGSEMSNVPTIDTSFFPYTQAWHYWTLTPKAGTSNMWTIAFHTGDEGALPKSDDWQYVRAVRGVSITPVIGDMNDDKNIDLVDVIIALKVVADVNNPGFSTGFPISQITVNGDDNVGLEEAIYDLQEVAGLHP